MALTDTKKAKDFMAGAPDITLKGDLRPIRKDEEEFPDTRDNPLNPFDKDLEDDKKMASMDENEREFMRLVEEFMERGFNQQEAIDAAREEFDKKAMAYGGRAQYGLGSLVKSIKKTAKKVLKSPIGKAALLYTVTGGLGNLAGGRALFKNFLSPTTFLGGAGDIFKKGALTNILNLSGAERGTGAAMDALKIGGAGSIITGLLASKEKQPGESNLDFEKRIAQVNDQLDVQFRRLYPQGGNETDEEYDIRISALVKGADDQTVPVGEMADGGRVMRAFGSDELVEEASGIEGLPININSKGVKELDLRETGGFIPPVGVKEKADDIPAMLSNNEFVFTADAVRAAGGGSVNKGAQRLYDTMKQLESKVV
jgi:hypothetical protein